MDVNMNNMNNSFNPLNSLNSFGTLGYLTPTTTSTLFALIPGKMILLQVNNQERTTINMNTVEVFGKCATGIKFYFSSGKEYIIPTREIDTEMQFLYNLLRV